METGDFTFIIYMYIYIYSIKLLKATFTSYYDFNAIVNNYDFIYGKIRHSFNRICF